MTPDIQDPKQALLQFRVDYGIPSGTIPGLPSDPVQMLNLAEARLLAVSILPEIEPTALKLWLDNLVWHADFSDRTWNAARNEAGLPVPLVSALNSGTKLSLPTFTGLLQRRDGPAARTSNDEGSDPPGQGPDTVPSYV